MTKNLWVIYNHGETLANGEAMFWSDHDEDTFIGWGSLASATIYTDEEKKSQDYIPGIESEWLLLPPMENTYECITACEVSP